tara:strand:- start:3007 stop:3252 length:246 start_codon:yes stop_codon:yes gene_type:complete
MKKTNLTLTVIFSIMIPTAIALGINKTNEIINRTPTMFNDGVCFNSITYADILCIGLLGTILGLSLAFLLMTINECINGSA